MRHILVFNISYFEEKFSDFLQLTNREKEVLINDYFEKIDKELQSPTKSTLFIENKHITLIEVAENDSIELITEFTERQQILDAIATKKIILEETEKELIELYKKNAMFCDENQWYVETVEDVVIKKRPKKVCTKKIGRVHWLENFMDQSTGDVIEIERAEIVSRDGIWFIERIEI